MASEKQTSVWGRAFIGGNKTSLFPALLTVESRYIKMFAFFGTYYFPSKFVSSIEEVSDNTIVIHHVISDYPAAVLFSGRNIIREVHKAGFLSCPNPNRHDKSTPDENPLKLWVPIASSLLFFLQGGLPWTKGGRSMLIAVLSIHALYCMALLLSKELQNTDDIKTGKAFHRN